MSDSSTANPPRHTKGGSPRIEPPASASVRADHEIGTFMKVLARLDPLSGRHNAKPSTMPLSISAAAPKAPPRPRTRSRTQGRAAR